MTRILIVTAFAILTGILVGQAVMFEAMAATTYTDGSLIPSYLLPYVRGDLYCTASLIDQDWVLMASTHATNGLMRWELPPATIEGSWFFRAKSHLPEAEG